MPPRSRAIAVALSSSLVCCRVCAFVHVCGAQMQDGEGGQGQAAGAGASAAAQQLLISQMMGGSGRTLPLPYLTTQVRTHACTHRPCGISTQRAKAHRRGRWFPPLVPPTPGSPEHAHPAPLHQAQTA